MAFDISKFAATLSPDVSESDTMLREIPIDQLHPNTRNFYPTLSPEDLDALTESIEANGLLEPLTVVPGEVPNDYRLISGHNRYRALSSLHERSPEETKWQTIPCIVLPALTREQELSAIIEANRQRKKTGALLAEEAEKLTESYVARQKAGEKLPGRIRERVAEALRVSQTKLATVQAIKKNLKVPGFRETWEKETLPESVAYEISKLEPEAQYRLLDLHVDQGEALTIRTVQQFGKAWLSCCHACAHTGHFCENAMTMVRNLLKSDGWHCAGCCDACLSKASCPYACQYTKTAALTAEPQPSAEDQQDDIPDYRRRGLILGARLTELRKATGMSLTEFADSISEYKATYSAWENGSLPGSGTMPKLALALKTTTDFLYGLSDERYRANPPAPASSEVWRPLDAEHWPVINSLVLLRGETPLQGRIYQAAHCLGYPDEQFPFEDARDHFELDHIDLAEFIEWYPLEGNNVSDSDTSTGSTTDSSGKA